MLLRFTQADMLNTDLVDIASGRPKYTILSRASYIKGKDNAIVDVASRTTSIIDDRRKVIATIEWSGKEKRSGGLIWIRNSELVKFAELFDGCDSVKTVPDRLVIPSRLGYVWVATRAALFVCGSDATKVVGKFHERSIQLGDTVTPSPIPKVGNDYLEFVDLPEDAIPELLVGYIFMNIMRRTRFDLPRYQFPIVDGSGGGRQTVADVYLNNPFPPPKLILGYSVLDRVVTYSESEVFTVHPAHMASVHTFVSNGLLGDLAMNVADDDAMQGQTAGGEYAPNGLLSDDESQEQTLVESRTMFKSNGLLGATMSGHDGVNSRPNGIATRNSGSTSTGICDATNTEHSSFPLKELAAATDEERDESEPNNLFEQDLSSGEILTSIDSRTDAQNKITESQELPSLSQILRPHGRKETSSSSKITTMYSTTMTTGSSVPISATAFDGKMIYLKKRPKKVINSRTTAENQRTESLLETPIHKLMDQLSVITAKKLIQPEAGPSTVVVSSSNPVEDELWVDRYRPSRFSDLLGDERVHRETMTWLKEWDYCVFGKRKALNRQKKTFNTQAAVLDNKYEDAHHRPYEKILLLSGPAGYGKTTLAHVAARQAGYEVMEINASDARSGQVIDDRIRPALESGSAVGSKKPHARIIRFTRPADIYLTKRLRSICENEGLHADSRALSTLVGVTKGDMRGCLNTLQFIKARNQDVTENIIRTSTKGMKEGDASFTSVLSSLFSPLPRKRVKELGLSELDENRRLGCFEHYANLRHYDASLARHGKAVGWLMTFDMLSGTMRSEREYGLLPYLPYLLVPFYPLFNERGGSKVERPKADWDNLMKTRTNEEIYKSLSKCVQSAGHRSAGLRHLLSNEIMQLEFAPYINRIISPPMRPVNSQVTRPQERALLARLVDIMVSLELRFIQEKAEDGQLTYRLDPPVDVFVTYDGKRSGDISVQRYATRQLIAGEIDIQLIARQAEATEREKPTTAGTFRKSRKTDDGDNSTLGKRKADLLDIADRPPVDFFGRPITVSAPLSKRSKGTGPGLTAPEEKKFKVSYRFREGNSAAVRKPVKVSSFL
ncbi:hypothetical protein EW145_g1444 [Phellinidium pouzarii]|uniref:ATPase AAA-type core domain-containing protein n=1 Tax=Phellinidium pouzarii TaxID=167371 RepID=A0A4S4LEV1_9AGAM|nr:hypothetical protein EW145_g1444 [Phellinidium pouzarii]